MSSDPSTIIGVDIGTTSTKAVAYDVAGRSLARNAVRYPLLEPRPGWAEQDPDVIVRAVIAAVRSVAGSGPVAALSFSGAMHSLLGLDADGAPLTRAVTWADGRAAAQAERLRASDVTRTLQQRTGTPIHPMSPLVKLIWFREQEPDLWSRVACWASIKDYVLLRLCGELVIDQSLASGTGLLDVARQAWDPEALRIAGIGPQRLPRLTAPTTVLPGLTPAAAATADVAPDTPVVVGAADGPLANLGVGAIRPGVAALSIGTSGALRVAVDRPAVDADGGVFCYVLAGDRWVVGGAINNGGVVLDWAGQALAPDVRDGPATLLALAAAAPPGSDGLLMLPYLLGERAPQWSTVARGAYVGLRREHGRSHLVRAALEGVGHQLALVLDAVRAAGHEVRSVRATGGFARSPFWRQLVADVLDVELAFPAEAEGSSLGAALLARFALGQLASLDDAADVVPVAEIVRPNPAAAQVYRAMRPIYASLVIGLSPAFAALQHLAPTPPANPPGAT